MCRPSDVQHSCARAEPRCGAIREHDEEGRGCRGERARGCFGALAQGRRACLGRACRAGRRHAVKSGSCYRSISSEGYVLQILLFSILPVSCERNLLFSILPVSCERNLQEKPGSTPVISRKPYVCMVLVRDHIMGTAQSCRGTCARRWSAGTMRRSTNARPMRTMPPALAMGSLRRSTTWVRALACIPVRPHMQHAYAHAVYCPVYTATPHRASPELLKGLFHATPVPVTPVSGGIQHG